MSEPVELRIWVCPNGVCGDLGNHVEGWPHRPPTVEDGNLEAAARQAFDEGRRVDGLTFDIAYESEQEQMRGIARRIVAAWLGVSDES